MSRFGLQKIALLIIPVICFFYIGLFVTMALWYPKGLDLNEWTNHVRNFTLVYILWLGVFLSYRLFDWDTLRTIQLVIVRIGVGMVLCLILAAFYFYFQPSLLITPRRFLIVHVLLSGIGIVLWFYFVRIISASLFRLPVYHHASLSQYKEVEILLFENKLLGLHYVGPVVSNVQAGSVVIIPDRALIPHEDIQQLFQLRNEGVQFIEYAQLHELVTRTIHLSALNDLWFISSINYRRRYVYDMMKRIIDVCIALIGSTLFIMTLPFIAFGIYVNSRGSLFFSQRRVGANGSIFKLYKYRTMTTDSSSDTWAHEGQKVTRIGKILRATRLDELPQCWNILKGDMSIVGPRPEQVHIVERLRNEIPYYDERHIVKPGLTGWAQLHVYASSVEETKRKLQYDLYYIKHRSLLFDAEIILKTIYNILTFAGR